MKDLGLVVAFLEENPLAFEMFQIWLEERREIDGSEAEVIVGRLKAIPPTTLETLYRSYDPSAPLKLLPEEQRRSFRAHLRKLPMSSQPKLMTLVSEIARRSHLAGKEQTWVDIKELLDRQPVFKSQKAA